MARITVRQVGKIVVDTSRAERLLPALIVGHVLNRTAAGKDVDGRPFRGYSPSYGLTLSRAGEGQSVDLRTTGGMLGSLRHLRTEKSGGLVSLVFGPGTGTSPAVRAKARKRPKSVPIGPIRPGRMSRTGQRSPPHNLVGLWLHRGTARMPARPWLGLGRAGEAMVARALEKIGVFRR